VTANVGWKLGKKEGAFDGSKLTVGEVVGSPVGDLVGPEVGKAVGEVVGLSVGGFVGVVVGLLVTGSFLQIQAPCAK